MARPNARISKAWLKISKLTAFTQKEKNFGHRDSHVTARPKKEMHGHKARQPKNKCHGPMQGYQRHGLKYQN
jgi:hypothetical protein